MSQSCHLTAVVPGRTLCRMLADQPTFLSLPEAAAAFEVSLSSVRRWVKDGRLKAITLPNGRRRIRREDVDAILSSDREPVSA